MIFPPTGCNFPSGDAYHGSWAVSSVSMNRVIDISTKGMCMMHEVTTEMSKTDYDSIVNVAFVTGVMGNISVLFFNYFHACPTAFCFHTVLQRIIRDSLGYCIMNFPNFLRDLFRISIPRQKCSWFTPEI